MPPRELELEVNGRHHRVTVVPEERLLDVLRDRLGLTGAKKGCEEGECGACTVLLDGRPVVSCLILAARAEGHQITTIEGLGTPEEPSPLQRAFVEAGAVQCGFCIPGMILSAQALLAEHPTPTSARIRAGLAGNLCRCTGYVQIFAAVERAARQGQHGDL